MKPQDWPAGVTLMGVYDGKVDEHPLGVFREWHGSKAYGVVNGDPDRCLCSLGDVESGEVIVGRFSDLSRRPSDEPVGARAVLVDASDTYAPTTLVGGVYEWRRGDFRRGKGASASHYGFTVGEDEDKFAPLSAEEEATEVERDDHTCCDGPPGGGVYGPERCDACKEEGEVEPTPAAPAEERCLRMETPTSLRCDELWRAENAMRLPHTVVDPCQPCAARIDAAEAEAMEVEIAGHYATMNTLACEDQMSQERHEAERDRLLEQSFRPWWRR